MRLLANMELDTVYIVKHSKNDTLLVGDHIWLASTSPKSINCVEVAGFLDESDSELITDVIIEKAVGWKVFTDIYSSKAYKEIAT